MLLKDNSLIQCEESEHYPEIDKHDSKSANFLEGTLLQFLSATVSVAKCIH